MNSGTLKLCFSVDGFEFRHEETPVYSDTLLSSLVAAAERGHELFQQELAARQRAAKRKRSKPKKVK